MNPVDVEAHVVRCLAEMHAVYRMFDKERNLLYVGVTGDAGQRFGDHSMKRWFPLVATIELEWYPTRKAAGRAEDEAILREKPRYNIQGNKAALDLLMARHGPALTSMPDVPRVDFTALADAKWQELAEATEIPSAARQVLARRLAIGTTISEVASEAGVSKWTARVWLERLRYEGAARIVGSRRTARWHATEALKSAAGGDGS